MMSFRIVALSLSWATLSSSLLCAGDLSRYREFQLDTSVLAVVKQAGMEPAEVKLIHQRPAVIQELLWQPQHRGSSLDADSVKEIQFSFYHDELFRMVVNYDPDKTEGLTAKDMIDAISTIYGTALYPAAEISLSSIDDNELLKVIARWEDSKYSFNLVRSYHQPNFTLVVLSKRLDPLARVAVIEAVRLEKQQAPQREIERQNIEDAQNRLQQATARLANKPGFRP